ncbi:sensor histidine kinase [Tabrizicola sp.]|uniref:sensor histidine kinase n=1 Tax=Tabrizicola sp. TaxID=2005166 RepID=UPI002FDD26AB
MLALMPLGVLSVVQARNSLAQVDATTLAGVGGAALQAVRTQIDVIKEAQISARVLATVLSDAPSPGRDCVERVTALGREIPQATLVAYIPLSGLMTCSSNGRVYDFKDEPRFQALIETPTPKITYNPHGPVSGTAIVGVSHPVFDRSGAQAGIAVISLSYSAVAPRDYSDTLTLWRPSYLATFLADGTLLLSSDPDTPPSEVIPASVDLADLTRLADHPTYVDDPGGRHILSVVGVTSDLYLLSIWRRSASSAWDQASAFTPYLLPLLTWIAALVAAAFASSRLVVRHVRALSRSMTNYVSTKQRLRIPDLSGAPDEIQRLHAAYEGLIRTIEQEEAELQNLLVDKDVLIREVNHRSGNSLQIIASIMRMYRRETTDTRLRAVLDGLINRVIALSSTHTSLYALSGQRDVSMDAVLSNVVKRLKEIHGVALGVASKRLQPIRMEAQAAVPLALALAEAVGCYFSKPNLGRDAVTVDLSESDDTIRLRIEGPAVPQLQPDTTDGLLALPQRMLRQFAAQLFGTVSIRIDGDRASVELVFPRPKTA